MTRTRDPLGSYITPDLNEARLARQRTAIADRLKPRRPRWYLQLAPAVCVAAIVFLLIRSHGHPVGEVTARTVVEAPSGEPLAMTLLDGSRVTLDPETKLSLMTLLAKDVRLQLDRGGIDLDVSHVKGRQFVVAAAGYEVRVLGTRFAVRFRPTDEGSALEVKVFRGRVRVTRIGEPADLRILGAGETWSTALGIPPGAPAPTASVEEPRSMQTPATGLILDDRKTPSVSPSTDVAPPAPSPRVVGAKELWSQAERARASRRFRDEAIALDMLRLRHRSDPRAGLAAFELGRLRQDTLHDPGGAAEAFVDAILLAPNGPFREDAEARRVEALETAGRRDQCVEAKAAFLARYPGGIHRERVSARCEPR